MTAPLVERGVALGSAATPRARPRRPQLVPWRSSVWACYFEWNAEARLVVPWGLGVTLTGDARRLVHASLPAWQLGETSDGAHLRRAAARHAAATGDADFCRAVELFIREEQRHGAELGRYLDLAGIPRLGRDWGDSAFRLLRHGLPGFEAWATPVVMVETLALVYYNAARRATGCPVLQRICQQILRDEVAHLRFHSQSLARLLSSRPPALRRATLRLQHALFAATVGAVWIAHGGLLAAGGYPWRRFRRVAWACMRRQWRAMDAERYRWR